MPNYITFGIFFTIVISITIGMVRFFIISLKKAFPSCGLHPVLLKVFYLPVPLSFFLFYNRDLEGVFYQTVLGYFLYFYFALLFVFFLYGIFFEFLILLRRKNFKKRKFMFAVISVIAFYTIAIGFYLVDDIQVEKLEITTPKIKQAVKIIQLSDIHFSMTTGAAFAEKIRNTVNSLKPDIVLVTGDFVDHGIAEPEKAATFMREINAPMGKYAISGNHEFINGFEKSVDYVKWSGFSFLYSESVKLSSGVTLVSVMDKTAKRFGYEIPDDIETLKTADLSDFVIFLKHQPSINDGTEQYFDLMLSGHTHGGQLFPFGIFVRMFFHYFSGTYKFKNGSTLHVNRGTGTWGPPVRFGAMPEITLITLLPENLEK
ncbi:MAG TPA: metallophosphoesterase [bacterium]|nr:metallophosphoesterase [bacterium]HPS30371.1 metallophosphoesterase [bacterium]